MDIFGFTKKSSDFQPAVKVNPTSNTSFGTNSSREIKTEMFALPEQEQAVMPNFKGSAETVTGRSNLNKRNMAGISQLPL